MINATTSANTEVPCQQTNGTDGADNSTRGQPCGAAGAGRGRPGNRGPATRTFYMQPQFEDPDGLYLKYDPMIGIRTATILGSCLFLMMFYVFYKAKCKADRWTSTDELYLENYKRRMATRTERKKNNKPQYSRLTKDGCSRPDPAALQATANWVQTLPLQASMPPGRPHRLAMCNICMQAKVRDFPPDGPPPQPEVAHTIIKVGPPEPGFTRVSIRQNLSNNNDAPAADEHSLTNADRKWQNDSTGRGRRHRKKATNIPVEYLNLHLDSLGNSAVAPVQSDPVPHLFTRSPSYEDCVFDKEKKVASNFCTFCDRDLLCTKHNQSAMGNHILHIPALHNSRSVQSSTTELRVAADLDHNLANNIKPLNTSDKNITYDMPNLTNVFTNSRESINSGNNHTHPAPISPEMVSRLSHHPSSPAPIARPTSIPLPPSNGPADTSDMDRCDSSLPVIGTSDSASEPIYPRLDIVIGADSDQSDQMTDISISKDSAGDTLSLSDPNQSTYELSGDLDFIDATPPNEQDELDDIEQTLKGIAREV